MTIATHTLGCKLNFAETSHLQRQMEKKGLTVVGFHEQADIYVNNTCTVTAVAEKKCRNAIRQAVAQNPKAVIAVIGCFAQRDAEPIARIPGVSIILGNDYKHRLAELLTSLDFKKPDQQIIETGEPKSFQLSYSGGDRTRTFFKIQDGCDYFCTYCAIPFARGRSRSATIEETVGMAREIAATGTREVVLTGVNTGTFGQQHGERFLDLLKALDEVEGIVRYRISSIEPNLITDEIIDFVATSRAFLPHFHIPLQAGSDKVLKMMRRRYDTALYASRVEHIKAVMPDACIAADVMAGFNGETEEEFLKVLNFIDSLPISYLHVFTYSDRPGPAALRLGEKIPIPVRHEHTARLLELSEKKHAEFISSQLGKARPVLWESSNHNGRMEGWTDNYIRLSRPYDMKYINTIETAEITRDAIVRED
ncbi:MAG: tRNA (N(6)-L-threonylcarbamoyladenosine(37)-C(2))-methylthiotransferase MtaB [Bacteroidales bacterium]|nr:tRNA (N(6)-L-threonylcarbamoyladenosine(37)-C(2))-methylthiotransferase MtaB [Bacteroidales bacterium]